MTAVELALLGERANPKGGAGRHLAAAIEAINELKFVEKMGGYLDAQAVPLPRKHLWLLVMLGELRAEKKLAQQHSGGGGAGGAGISSSTPGLAERSGITGVAEQGGWRRRNRGDAPPEVGRDPRLPAAWAG